MLKSYFQCLAYDQDCSYLRQSRRKRSRSFVQGFLKLHYGWMDVGNITITNIEGESDTYTAAQDQSEQLMNATSPGRGGSPIAYYSDFERTLFDDSDWKAQDAGIVVGTGTTAVAPTDYQLATRIADGITSGTLEYFSCGGTSPTTSSTSGSFTLERLFRNSSGSSITVNEVGVYGLKMGGGTTGFYYCLIRDLVSPGFTVLNGEYMRVIYTITVTA